MFFLDLLMDILANIFDDNIRLFAASGNG